MAKTLLIDLDQVNKRWQQLGIQCSYPYHFKNDGVVALREWLAFQIVCRRCEDYPCVHACRYDALERVEETGLNIRNDCLCVSCRSCALACPFGVIYMEVLSFLTFHCDLCEGRLQENEEPLCVKTSSGTIQYGDFEEDKQKNICKVGQVLVKVKPWKKEPEGSRGK